MYVLIRLMFISLYKYVIFLLNIVFLLIRNNEEFIIICVVYIMKFFLI